MCYRKSHVTRDSWCRSVWETGANMLFPHLQACPISFYKTPVAKPFITEVFSAPERWRSQPVFLFLFNKIAELFAPLVLLQSLASLYPIFPLMVKIENLRFSAAMPPLHLETTAPSFSCLVLVKKFSGNYQCVIQDARRARFQPDPSHSITTGLKGHFPSALCQGQH